MIIEATGLSKTFPGKGRKSGRRVEAVESVDLTVKEGEIFGFLGPNGAGKTTTLRMLATLLRPDSGSATVAGADLVRDPAAVRRRIGYVAQSGGTWRQMSARSELVLQARLHGSTKSEALERTERALSAFQLTEFADRAIGTYSGGQRRRVEIALGVIHDPAVLFLDEPSVGLDPQSRAHLWDEVRRLREEGTTVFLTTHYLDEADALCDRLAIIDHGGIIAAGTPEALKHEVCGDVVTVTVPEGLDRARALVASLPYVSRVDGVVDGLRLVVDNAAATVPQLLRTLDEHTLTVTGLELHSASLDDVFLDKTGRSLRQS